MPSQAHRPSPPQTMRMLPEPTPCPLPPGRARENTMAGLSYVTHV